MDSYLGEIRMFGGNFAPRGWLPCDGRLLQIAQYEFLFMLLGTTYGGDGEETFALPDLRGRMPVQAGTNEGQTYTLGQTGGAEARTLTPANLPSHTHTLQVAQVAGTTNKPSASVLPAATSAGVLYTDQTANPAAMNPATVTSAGSSQPISLMMPYAVINFIIATEGIYPSA